MIETMKAYSVSDKNGNCGYSYVVFAETRAKAIKYALDHCDGCFDYYGWTEMRAIRKPSLDKHCNGRREMDWSNDDDRVAMVRDAGFECSGEYDVTIDECERCPAHEWCDRFDNMKR